MTNDLALVQSYLVKGEGLEVRNPATGEPIATVADEPSHLVEERLQKAEAAQKLWAKEPAKTRSAILKRWNDLMLANKEALARLCTLECGKPLAESAGEVVYAASFIEWFAEEAKRTYGEVIPQPMNDRRLLVVKQPVGVVAAITPWNFPLAMITRKAAPALAAGCSFVVKPAEATPLSALAMEALAIEAGIPADLFQVTTTTDPARTGDILCASSLVKKLSFTGSTAVGKILLRQCSDTVKRTSMELGGNAPMIIFDDADLDKAVRGTLMSKYRNAGQTCVCSNRILVHAGVKDQFTDKLLAAVSDLKMGDGLLDGTTLGPLITPAARDKVSGLVTRSIENGAKVLMGGPADTAPGQFYPATVLTDVTADMEIARSEIFGPVAPIISFETEEEAVRIANDTPYGLAAYFYTRDHSRIWRVMEGLDYGMVGVNEGILSTELAPFGGVKESGLGREGSHVGIDEYLELKYACMGGLEA